MSDKTKAEVIEAAELLIKHIMDKYGITDIDEFYEPHVKTLAIAVLNNVHEEAEEYNP